MKPFNIENLLLDAEHLISRRTLAHGRELAG